MNYIDVAVGVILRDNKTYVCLRASDKHQGGKWEFPGGKIKPRESGPDCVIRRARETLNVLVDPGNCIKQIKHSYSHFTITVDAYRCVFVGGQPRRLGYDDFRWIYPYEIHQFAFHRSNHKLFDKIEGVVSI